MLTQEEKEKRKKEEEKTRKDKEKAQLLEKELLFGSSVPVATAKTPGKTKPVINPRIFFFIVLSLIQLLMDIDSPRNPLHTPYSEY